MISAATKSAEDTREAGAALAALVQPGDVVLLAGGLGAGKTTFTQGFGRGLGVEDVITSPTFTLMRPHEGRLTLLHCDLYRLDHLQEIADLGISELVDDDAVAVIEWGDLAEPILPADFLEVRIGFGDGVDDDERRLDFRPVGSAWASRTAVLERALGRWLLPDRGGAL